MIEIYRVGASPTLLSQGESEAEAVVEANASLLMIYVDYEKGSEEGLRVSVSVGLKGIEEFSVTDSSYLNPIPSISASGRYRIPVPLSRNEDSARVKVGFDGDASNAGTAKVYVEVVR